MLDSVLLHIASYVDTFVDIHACMPQSLTVLDHIVHKYGSPTPNKRTLYDYHVLQVHFSAGTNVLSLT